MAVLPRIDRRIAILAALAAVAALLTLRESGLIWLKVNTAKASMTQNSDWFTPPEFEFANGSTLRVDFESAGCFEPPADGVQVAGRKPVDEIVVHVDPYEVEGCTWLPLHKWGSCSYHATVVLNGARWGSVDGQMDMTVEGLASSRDFRESMREELRTRITETVQPWWRR